MKLATLFSGVGAPEQASKRVYGDGLELVFACEWDKYARESFNANYKIAPEHFHKDINELDGTQYQGQVDCIVGGSPCQDFSLAGLRAGIDGHRGQLIWQYYRTISEIKPKYFVYENVKGMLSDKNGKTLSDFLEMFRTLGYLCHFEVLDSRDYGVPHHRERLWLVGFLDEREYFKFRFADKIPLTRTIRDVLEDAPGSKYFLSKPIDEYNQESQGNKVCDGDVFHTLVAGTHGYANGYVVDDKPKILQVGRGYNKGGEHDICPTITSNSFEHNNFVVSSKVSKDIKPSVRENFIRDYEQIVASDKPVFYSECKSGFQDNKVCLTESACLRAHNDNLFTLDKQKVIRKLTPRECFRLQDFPDSFKFVVSDTQLYKQAGNSMTVVVLEMIFRQLSCSDARGDLFDFLD